MTLWTPKPPLHGAAVFLSASVPHPERDKRFLAGPLDDWLMLRVIDQRICDAVQSLAAQVLMAGGRLVHGGHPSITNAIAAQAGNWMPSAGEGPAEADSPVLLYQSEFFSGKPAPPGREEMAASGFASVRWTPSALADSPVDGFSIIERHGIKPEWIEDWLPNQAAPGASAALREALLVMRLQMLLETQPLAAVCIGGMEGIEAEAKLYSALCHHGLLPGDGTVQVVASTFGAAAQLEGEQVRLVDGRDRSTAATAEVDLLERLDYDGVMRGLVVGMVAASSAVE
ncbi:MAG: hypothetical protein ACK587_09260 [Cyanobacteriota bacterium]